MEVVSTEAEVGTCHCGGVGLEKARCFIMTIENSFYCDELSLVTHKIIALLNRFRNK